MQYLVVRWSRPYCDSTHGDYSYKEIVPSPPKFVGDCGCKAKHPYEGCWDSVKSVPEELVEPLRNRLVLGEWH